MIFEKLLSKSSREIKILQFAKAVIIDTRAALYEMSRFERLVHCFWLVGPFILLIERTPADIWVSLIGVTFLARCFFIRDFEWLHVFWVKAGLIFWLWCLFSALMSEAASYSFGEALAWGRFPIFACASAFWLTKDRRLLYAMLFSTTIGLCFMCLILSAELLIVGQQHGRLSWPYGDLMPGSYVAKVGLPIFTMMVALAVSASGRIAAVSAFIALFTLLISLMTGERINFLIRACGGMLAGLLWKPKLGRYCALVFVEVSAVILLFRYAPQIKVRFVNNFIEQLPVHTGSPYFKAMMPGIEIFKGSPVMGIGPGNFRNMCSVSIDPSSGYVCHPHPHNFYIQLLCETGLIGLFLGCLFLCSIVWTCFVSSRESKHNVFFATAWVIPFGLFWPFASTADFFGQWNNIFLWSAVAIALSHVKNKRLDN